MEEMAQPVSLANLTERQRAQAMARLATLQRTLNEMSRSPAPPMTAASHSAPRDAGCNNIAPRGLPGLVPAARSDTGKRKLSAELTGLIEGLALRKARPSVAALHRVLRSCRVGNGRGGLRHGQSLRFPSPLIEPDVRISRIRLSDWIHRRSFGPAVPASVSGA
jgi:hypothetical protein